MRLVIVFDMEGASHVRDFHEICPVFPEYWDTGRRALTSDVSAAALGLLEGGATEVVVMNHHGAGEVEWPNVIPDELPDGVHLIDWDELAMREHVDAMFQVGVHARGGSPTFFSHTILPGLRLRIGDELLSESHLWTWTGDVPVLGMVGAAALESELGSLSHIPFLAVQDSDDRGSARPRLGTREQTDDAIRAFARSAMRSGVRRGSGPPHPVVLDASIHNPDDAAAALIGAGWTRTSRTEFRIAADAWRSDDEPIVAAIGAAAGAAWQPYAWSLDGLDPTDRATAAAFPAALRTRTDAWLAAWTTEATPEWIAPEQPARLEGLEVSEQP